MSLNEGGWHITRQEGEFMSTAAHLRQHNSMLASAEKRALIWMALRLPRWIHSDHLSALGLLSMAGAGLSFWFAASNPIARSEERRVGKECRSRWSPYH